MRQMLRTSRSRILIRFKRRLLGVESFGGWGGVGGLWGPRNRAREGGNHTAPASQAQHRAPNTPTTLGQWPGHGTHSSWKLSAWMSSSLTSPGAGGRREPLRKIRGGGGEVMDAPQATGRQVEHAAVGGGESDDRAGEACPLPKPKAHLPATHASPSDDVSTTSSHHGTPHLDAKLPGTAPLEPR